MDEVTFEIHQVHLIALTDIQRISGINPASIEHSDTIQFLRLIRRPFQIRQTAQMVVDGLLIGLGHLGTGRRIVAASTDQANEQNNG